jgi:hypothetical protein
VSITLSDRLIDGVHCNAYGPYTHHCDACAGELHKYFTIKSYEVYGEHVTVCSPSCLAYLYQVWRPSLALSTYGALYRASVAAVLVLMLASVLVGFTG